MTTTIHETIKAALDAAGARLVTDNGPLPAPAGHPALPRHLRAARRPGGAEPYRAL
jgi:hypothetical protein